MSPIDALTFNSSNTNTITSQSSDDKQQPLNIPINEYKSEFIKVYKSSTLFFDERLKKLL